MIESFADKSAAQVWAGEPCKKLPSSIHESAREAMRYIDAAATIESLWAIPGLQAKKLLVRGRPHLWSTRINQQWRVIFDWEAATQSAHNVQIIDYH
jgi:toxin HigB-1